MPKEVIKITPNKNEYLLTPDKMWVRNPCKTKVPYFGINRMGRETDVGTFLDNELENIKVRYPDVDTESIVRSKVLIVSDGFGFEEKQSHLKSLPNDITIFAVNKALAKWKLQDTKPIHYYVVNNPYPECMVFLPKKTRYFKPKCVASTRTYPEFLSDYKGTILMYSPVPELNYSGPNFTHAFKVDDYRNPICAALNLAFRMAATKIALFCCDDSFATERPGSVQTEDGLWSYPQHVVSRNIIDANIYWMKKHDIQVVDHSCGQRLKYADYISEEKLTAFFQNE